MGVTKPVASRKVQPIAGPSPRTGRPALQSTQTKKGNDARVKDETQVQIVTRDPRSINEHVKVQFEDVLGEPVGVRTVDCCWIKSFVCYTCCKNCLYRFVSLIFGFPLATIYGCLFGCTAFPHVWCITPFSKAFQICCHSFSRIFRQCILCVIGAPCENCGEIFSAFNTNGKKKGSGVTTKRGGVTFNDKVKTRKIPARNTVGVKDQQVSRIQAVRQQRR